MNKEEFLEAFRELIQEEGEISLDTPLDGLESWDSMAIMAVIAWLDVERHTTVSFEDLQALDSVGEIAALLPDFKA